MIMTHGLGSGSCAFQPLTEIFSPNYTVIRIDWPGHGHSSLSKSGKKFTMNSLVEILEGVMDHLELQDAVLVGHSAGGIASMMLAAKSPQRVRGLAVIGAGRTRAGNGPPRTATLELAEWARTTGIAPEVDARVQHNIPKSSPPLARALLRSLTATTNPEGYAQLCDALCDASHVDPDYSAIVCPVSVVGGRTDPISPVAVTDELVSLMSNGGRKPWRVVLETGHMMIIEEAAGIAEALGGMLQAAQGPDVTRGT